jgi:hypothetical protein
MGADLHVSPRLRGVIMRWVALLLCVGFAAQPLAATAAAGWQQASRCCCPSVQECHCPDAHDSPAHDSLRNCSNSGDVTLPALIKTTLAVPSAWRPLICESASAVAPPQLRDSQWLSAPECPPF